jgi:hypothetical protein
MRVMQVLNSIQNVMLNLNQKSDFQIKKNPKKMTKPKINYFFVLNPSEPKSQSATLKI